MILFLDIDGVLHPEPATIIQMFSQKEILCELLKLNKNIKVVISSDWRRHNNLQEIIDLIVPEKDNYLRELFIGVTPVIKELKCEYRGREKECLMWLEENNYNIEDWFAIDDIAGNFAYGSKNLFLTDYKIGLQEENIGQILKMMEVVKNDK